MGASLPSQGRIPSFYKPIVHRETIQWRYISCEPQDILPCQLGIQMVLRLTVSGRARLPLESQICGQLFHPEHHNCLNVHLPQSTNRSMVTREHLFRHSLMSYPLTQLSMSSMSSNIQITTSSDPGKKRNLQIFRHSLLSWMQLSISSSSSNIQMKK